MSILSDAESRGFSTFLDSFSGEPSQATMGEGAMGYPDDRGGGMLGWTGAPGGVYASPPVDLQRLSTPFLPQSYDSNYTPANTHYNRPAYPGSSISTSASYATYLPPTLPHASYSSTSYVQAHQNTMGNMPYLSSAAPSSRPGFTSTHSAPPSDAYPTQPLQSLDDEKLRRMAQQTKDLEAWMKARGGEEVYATGGGVKGKGVEGRKLEELEGDWLDEQHYGGRRSSPKKSRSLGNGYADGSELYQQSDVLGQGKDDTMLLMREAEDRSAFARNVTVDHSRNIGAQGGTISVSALQYSLSPSTIPADLTNEVPEPTNKKVTTKRKAPATKQTPRASASIDTSQEIDSIRNPPPTSTPRNIPASPHGPRPPDLRPPPPVPSLSTSHSTSNQIALPPKVKKEKDTSDPSKPALLSTEQKKANHIASEQKRRAAIRSGYEGLCSVVPSLRAAVEEFEERVKKVGKGERKKSGGSGALMGGIEVGGEKVDGRAGPRSEAVVLGKCKSSLL